MQKYSNLTKTKRCQIFKKSQIKLKNSSELIFLRVLKNLKIKVFYQNIISPYILDFYLPTYGIAIEVDGEIHNKRTVEIRDNRREYYISSFGIRVMRYNISLNKETPLEFINNIIKNFSFISRTQRNKIKRKILHINRILLIKKFRIEKIETYDQVKKEYEKWKKDYKETIRCNYVNKTKDANFKSKYFFYKNRDTSNKFIPKLPAIDTLLIKQNKYGAWME